MGPHMRRRPGLEVGGAVLLVAHVQHSGASSRRGWVGRPLSRGPITSAAGGARRPMWSAILHLKPSSCHRERSGEGSWALYTRATAGMSREGGVQGAVLRRVETASSWGLLWRVESLGHDGRCSTPTPRLEQDDDARYHPVSPPPERAREAVATGGIITEPPRAFNPEG
jgi:hypothetical protein